MVTLILQRFSNSGQPYLHLVVLPIHDTGKHIKAEPFQAGLKRCPVELPDFLPFLVRRPPAYRRLDHLPPNVTEASFIHPPNPIVVINHLKCLSCLLADAGEYLPPLRPNTICRQGPVIRLHMSAAVQMLQPAARLEAPETLTIQFGPILEAPYHVADMDVVDGIVWERPALRDIVQFKLAVRRHPGWLGWREINACHLGFGELVREVPRTRVRCMCIKTPTPAANQTWLAHIAQIPVPVPTSRTVCAFFSGARNSLLSSARFSM
jgi:hypothetical protein